MIRRHVFARASAALAVLAVLAGGCDFKEPVLPTWQTTVRLPFSETFILGEELGSDSLDIAPIPGDPDSILALTISGDIDLGDLNGEELAVKPEDESDRATLDTLAVDDLVVGRELDLLSLVPVLDNLRGQTVTLPDCTLGPAGVTAPSQNFRRLAFRSGEMTLRITNRLPFTIGPNGDSPGLAVTVSSDSTGTDALATFFFPDSIPPGTTVQSATVLTDRELLAPVRFDYEVPLARSHTIDVSDALLDTSGLDLELSLTGIQAQAIEGRVPAQRFRKRIRLGYEGDTRLRRATIVEGGFDLALQNDIPLDANVAVLIPGLRSLGSGDPYRRTLALPASGTDQYRLDLQGYELIDPVQPDAIIDSIDIRLDISTAPSDGIVALTSGDAVRYDITADSIFLGVVEGVIGGDTLVIDPIEVEDVADYGDFDGGVELQDADLELTILSEVTVESLIADLNIVAIREEAGVAVDSAVLVLSDQQIAGGSPEDPGETRIIVGGAEIVALLNILPTHLRFYGEVRASGEARISREGGFAASYRFSTPLRLRIENLTTFEADPDTLTSGELVDAVRETADEDLKAASLSFRLTNQTPLGGSVRFLLSADMADTNIYVGEIDTALGFVREVSFAAAPTDGNGFVTEPRIDEITVSLSERELRLFARPPLVYGLQVRVDDTDGYVTVRAFDFIDVNGAIAVQGEIRDE